MTKLQTSPLTLDERIACGFGIFFCAFWAFISMESALEQAGVMPHLITRPDAIPHSAHDIMIMFLLGIVSALVGVCISVLRFWPER